MPERREAGLLSRRGASQHRTTLQGRSAEPGVQWHRPTIGATAHIGAPARLVGSGSMKSLRPASDPVRVGSVPRQTPRSAYIERTRAIRTAILEHSENVRLRSAHIPQVAGTATRRRERQQERASGQNARGIRPRIVGCPIPRTRRRTAVILARARMCMIQAACLRAFGAHA